MRKDYRVRTEMHQIKPTLKVIQNRKVPVVELDVATPGEGSREADHEISVTANLVEPWTL